MGQYRQAREFLRDTRGQVATIMAISMTAILCAVAGGVDYSRSVAIGTKIQSALDSGVLAAASLSQTRPADDVVRSYVEAALEEHPELIEALTLEVEAEITFNARTVTASAEVGVPTGLLGIAGIRTVPVRRAATAVEQVRNIEISLVLDTSGSMGERGGGKIIALRQASAEFIDVVLASNPERTSLSFIPYNGGVRTPDIVNRALVSADSPVNGRRDGCLELGAALPIQINLPPGSLYWLSWKGVLQHGSARSNVCPRDTASSVFLSNARADLMARSRGLPAEGNTGLDVAVAWGARALDPAWRGRLGGSFSGRPAAYSDTDTIKVLVVMTDGEATGQKRPTSSQRTVRKKVTEVYYDARGRRRTRKVWRDVVETSWDERPEIYNAAQARRNMTAACDAAERNGVHVYTIAFQLRSSGARTLMLNCASRPQNFYNVEGLDIRSAFSAIAADINQLRISN